jgi:predicted transcriptional regulator
MYTNANGDRNTRSPVANDSCYSYPFDAIEQTLFELANADRLRILFKLNEDKQSNLSKIARDLNLIVQEVHRNINRLIEAGFVHKQSANNYSLTTFGRSLLLHLSSLKFLSENNAYFSDHTFGELPLKFVQRIGALDNSRLLESSVAVFEYPRELFDSSHSYVYAIMSEVPLHFIEYAWRALMRGVKMNYLVSHNAVVPRKRHSESEHSKFIELLKMSQLQRRMIEQVQV